MPANFWLVAGFFDVGKSYCAVDQRNVYSEAGRILHRGIEISLAG
ncbi:hypothetical protein [Novosphingobium sp. Rr 2-17]|nr:hypothetical protein [Novosphingobium sp. Rr 2-17]